MVGPYLSVQEEVFSAIHDLHVQTALTDNQFSGQKVGVFDVTGIERAVWGARIIYGSSAGPIGC